MGLWRNDERDQERHPFLDQVDDGSIAVSDRPELMVVTDDRDTDGDTAGDMDAGELAVIEHEDDRPVDDVAEHAETVAEADGAAVAESQSDTATAEPVEAPALTLGDEVNAIVDFARATTAEAMERARRDAEDLRSAAMTESEATVREAEQAAMSLRRATEDETRAMRAAAEADVQSMRAVATEEALAITQSAKSTRDEAVAFRQAARDEADAMLESARATLANAEARAREILAEARREADKLSADAAAREEQLTLAKQEAVRRLEAADAAVRALHEVAGSGDVA